MPFIILLGLSVWAACGDKFTAGSGGSGAGSVVTDETCNHVGECTVPEDLCINLSCQNNRCVHDPIRNGQPIPAVYQTDNDCNERRCQNGNVGDAFDVNDPQPSEDCVYYECIQEDGNVRNEPVLLGPETACGSEQQFFCNGQGECTGCTTSDECGQSMDPCKYFECSGGGVCQSRNRYGMPAPEQTDGDCLTEMCAMGGNTFDANDMDVPLDDDIYDCAEPLCSGGMPGESTIGDDLPCGKGGNQVCCGGECCAQNDICDSSGQMPVCATL